VKPRKITLAHGAGGRETSEIIDKFFVRFFKLKKVSTGFGLDELEDSSTIPLPDGSYLAVTVDSYTVNPVFFPGGNIGKLAATGTLNDLAVMGAKPIAAMDSVVVEEGFEIEMLKKIISSVRNVLERYGVALIGGDFKVMPRGQIDKIVITMVGLGIIPPNRVISDYNIKPGDKIVITGTIGEHGAAILAAQSGIGLEEQSLVSDCSPVIEAMEVAFKVGGIRAAKDPTRGGLAMALNEWARKSKITIVVREENIPLREEVKAYCEMLGIDPLTLASEGRALIAVAPEKAEELVKALRKIGYVNAAIIGEAKKGREGYVLLETITGGLRILEMPVGEIVPRIC